MSRFQALVRVQIGAVAQRMAEDLKLVGRELKR